MPKETRVRVWVKAFIPKRLYDAANEEITFYSRLLTLPTEGNATVFPWITAFPSLCFLLAAYATDNREFSNDPEAPARISTGIDVNLSENRAQVSRVSNPTYQVRGLLMDWVNSEKDKVSYIKNVPHGKESIETGKNEMHIAFSSELANPFFAICGHVYAPPVKIELDLDLNWNNPAQIRAHLHGRMTHFPAFEAYMQVDDQQPVCLLQAYPKPGATPFHLFYGWQSVNVEKIVSMQREEKENTAEPSINSSHFRELRDRASLKLTG